MFKPILQNDLENFRLIYHQTTNYSNPIVESVLYDKKELGVAYYWGDLIDGNYMIFHKSGFSHINFNPFDTSNSVSFFNDLDSFILKNNHIPNYLMFYNTPNCLVDYWKNQNKLFFNIRKRIRYQLDEIKFKCLDKSIYAIPYKHELRPLHKCSEDIIKSFGIPIYENYYNSFIDFIQSSFGFVLLNEDKKPVSISYLLCFIGRNSECSLITLPEFRNKGYGFINISNYINESLNRKIVVGWDCFISNYTNKWIKIYGYSKIIRKYDFVTFLKK